MNKKDLEIENLIKKNNLIVQENSNNVNTEIKKFENFIEKLEKDKKDIAIQKENKIKEKNQEIAILEKKFRDLSTIHDEQIENLKRQKRESNEEKEN